MEHETHEYGDLELMTEANPKPRRPIQIVFAGWYPWTRSAKKNSLQVSKIADTTDPSSSELIL